MVDKIKDIPVDELEDMILGLRMSGFAFVEEGAMDTVNAIISSSPSREAIEKMSDSSDCIKKLENDIGKLMAFLETHGKKDLEYKTRYESRTDLPPRYKVLDWKMKTLANKLIKALIKISAYADECGNEELASRFLKCAEEVSLFSEIQKNPMIKEAASVGQAIGGFIGKGFNMARLTRTKAKLNNILKILQEEQNYIDVALPKIKDDPRTALAMKQVSIVMRQMQDSGQSLLDRVDDIVETGQTAIGTPPVQSQQPEETIGFGQEDRSDTGFTSSKVTPDPSITRSFGKPIEEAELKEGNMAELNGVDYPIREGPKGQFSIEVNGRPMIIQKHPDKPGRYRVSPITRVPMINAISPIDLNKVTDVKDIDAMYRLVTSSSYKLYKSAVLTTDMFKYIQQLKGNPAELQKFKTQLEERKKQLTNIAAPVVNIPTSESPIYETKPEVAPSVNPVVPSTAVGASLPRPGDDYKKTYTSASEVPMNTVFDYTTSKGEKTQVLTVGPAEDGLGLNVRFRDRNGQFRKEPNRITNLKGLTNPRNIAQSLSQPQMQYQEYYGSSFNLKRRVLSQRSS